MSAQRMNKWLGVGALTMVLACGGATTDDGGGGESGDAGGNSGKSTKGGSGGTKSGGSGGTKSTKGGSGGSTSTKGGSGGSSKTGGSGGSTSTKGGAGGSTRVSDGKLPESLKDGLIGYWPFDEGTGTMVEDKSGNKNHGTVVQGAQASSAGVHSGPTWEAGKFGKALRIDGNDDWVRVPDSDSLDTTGSNTAVSASAWVNIDKLNGTKPYNVLVNRNEDGTRIEQFGLSLVDGLPSSTIHFFTVSAPDTLPLGSWHNVAFTYDSITVKVFVDGNQVAFLDIGWPISVDVTDLTFGAAINEQDVIENIDGRIDDVRLWNRPLTEDEVIRLFEAKI